MNVEELLENGNKKIIELDVKPYYIINYPNNKILSSSYQDSCLSLYDENFVLIKRIDKINEEALSPLGITLNKTDGKLFISDKYLNKIFRTDFEFNYINSVGSYGTDIMKFNVPIDICFKNGYLYVCDFKNKRLQLFDSELEFIKILKLEYMPWKIEASNSILCLASGYTSLGIYFYHIENLSLLRKFDHGMCRISEINSRFYEFESKSKNIFCYDETGNLEKKISFVSDTFDYNCLENIVDGSLISLNKTLLMTSFDEKKLIMFSKN